MIDNNVNALIFKSPSNSSKKIYKFSDDNLFIKKIIQTLKITASDGTAGDQFGYSVAISNNKIVVGPPFDDDKGSNSGSVYVYDLDGSNEIKITASDGTADDQFGYSVAISNNKIVVGAPGDDDSGSVYVYDFIYALKENNN